MTEIINSGERVLLEKETPLMIARHFSAYRFIKDYTSNKHVLDIGCGEGYGTYYLSEFARGTVGIDYDDSIINYAKDKYRKENLEFHCYNIEDLHNFAKKFNVICSFQVIEHLHDADKFLEDLKVLLDDNGVFICSTPNRLDASPHSETPFNKFHAREYGFLEFKGLIERHFKDVEMFGLKRGKELNFYRRIKKIGLCNLLPDAINPVKRFYSQIKSEHFSITKGGIDRALDFIVVCKK